MMIPFRPWAMSIGAYQQWQRAIKMAKEAKQPRMAFFFCNEAVKAQADYVMFSAIDLVNYFKTKGNL